MKILYTKHMNACHPHPHSLLSLRPPPPRSDRLWVRQVTFNQSLNRSYVSVRDSLVWIPNWPLDWEADGASNELGDQYAEATANKEEGGREGWGEWSRLISHCARKLSEKWSNTVPRPSDFYDLCSSCVGFKGVKKLPLLHLCLFIYKIPWI